MPNFRSKKKEDFEKDFEHKVVYKDKVDEKSLQEWTDELQSKCQVADREREARERKWMEMEDSSSRRRRTWRSFGNQELSPHRRTCHRLFLQR